MNHVLSRSRALSQGQALRWARSETLVSNCSAEFLKRETLGGGLGEREGQVGNEAATVLGTKETC